MNSNLLNQRVTAHDVRGHVVVGKIINLSNDGKMAFIRAEAFLQKPTFYVARVDHCQLQGVAHAQSEHSP